VPSASSTVDGISATDGLDERHHRQTRVGRSGNAGSDDDGGGATPTGIGSLLDLINAEHNHSQMRCYVSDDTNIDGLTDHQLDLTCSDRTNH
jgi:hypothetical protein